MFLVGNKQSWKIKDPYILFFFLWKPFKRCVLGFVRWFELGFVIRVSNDDLSIFFIAIKIKKQGVLGFILNQRTLLEAIYGF
jgi:hypothetical protein